MGSIDGFNRHAAFGRSAAEKYCAGWASEIERKGRELTELFKAKLIDVKSYNVKRSVLNCDTKDLNSCIAKVNKRR